MRAAVSCFAVLVALTLADASLAEDECARSAAATFGKALVGKNAGALLPILPQEGRVHVSLARLGPEDGRFGANQVVALFREFLGRGKVTDFEILRCESDGNRSALAKGRASIVDRDGRSGRIGVHLAFEREGPRWVLREVKETAE